jgi:hypothetical protein
MLREVLRHLDGASLVPLAWLVLVHPARVPGET